MRKFKLEKAEIDFLKKVYPEDSLIQKILSFEKNGEIEVDIDTKVAFMEFLEDESIYWLSEDYESTPNMIMLERIRDSIYAQTN